MHFPYDPIYLQVRRTVRIILVGRATSKSYCSGHFGNENQSKFKVVSLMIYVSVTMIYQ